MTNAQAIANLRIIRARLVAGTLTKGNAARLLYALGVCFVDETQKPAAIVTAILQKAGGAGNGAAQKAVIAALNGASGDIANAVAIIKIGTQHGAALSGKAPPTDAQIQAAVAASAS